MKESTTGTLEGHKELYSGDCKGSKSPYTIIRFNICYSPVCKKSFFCYCFVCSIRSMRSFSCFFFLFHFYCVRLKTSCGLGSQSSFGIVLQMSCRKRKHSASLIHKWHFNQVCFLFKSSASRSWNVIILWYIIIGLSSHVLVWSYLALIRHYVSLHGFLCTLSNSIFWEWLHRRSDWSRSWFN